MLTLGYCVIAASSLVFLVAIPGHAMLAYGKDEPSLQHSGSRFTLSASNHGIEHGFNSLTESKDCEDGALSAAAQNELIISGLALPGASEVDKSLLTISLSMHMTRIGQKNLW